MIPIRKKKKRFPVTSPGGIYSEGGGCIHSEMSSQDVQPVCARDPQSTAPPEWETVVPMPRDLPWSEQRVPVHLSPGLVLNLL